MRIEEAELRDVARAMLAGMGERPEPAAAWSAVREAGWTGLTAPEAQGGLGQPLAAACWLYRELGRTLSPAPLLASLVAIDTLAACPPSPARDDWIARIAGGEPVAAALIDPAATPLETGETVAGTLTAVVGIEGASHALVAAPGIVAMIGTEATGTGLSPHRTWDETRTLADLILSDAEPGDGPIATGDAAAAAIAAAGVHLHFGIAADCVGGAEAALEQTVAYLKDRRQFDRPLAMFQALKHRCADLRAKVSAASALLDGQLAALERGDGDPQALARAAKSLASRTYRAVAEEAIQLHGGMGMTAEHPIHRYLKRALLNEQLASPDDACDLAVGEALVAEMAGR